MSDKDKRDKDEDAPQQIIDSRLDWFLEPVTKILKVKSDKWKKMCTVNENCESIVKFLEDPAIACLFLTLNARDDIITFIQGSSQFPTSFKKKAIYFLKIGYLEGIQPQGSISKEQLDKSFIIGDLAPNPLEFLSTLLEDIYLPVLSNKGNLEGWPDVVATDVVRSLRKCQGSVFITNGLIKGKTMLPLPHGIDSDMSTKVVKSSLHSLEATVMDWSHQIEKVLKSSSSTQLDEGHNPGPSLEIQFWQARVANLRGMDGQLRGPKISMIGKILQNNNSSYFSSFSNILEDVKAGS
ncbi:Dynein heavy chain 9, axonemal [Coelomomyces lativittatus]|nr:Dynein heavy chain 9, axonemal [Coelomomyces lativittatus]